MLLIGNSIPELVLLAVLGAIAKFRRRKMSLEDAEGQIRLEGQENGWQYMDGVEAEIYDEALDATNTLSEYRCRIVHHMIVEPCVSQHCARRRLVGHTTTGVVCFSDEMKNRLLPRFRRTEQEGEVVGRAAKTFHVSPNGDMPSYITGCLTLPPKGIKDPESSGECAQVFTVVSGQPGAVEVAFGMEEQETEDERSQAPAVLDPDQAQRFLLSPKDQFRVPPGNVYRIHNHSKTHEAYLTWVIVRGNR